MIKEYESKPGKMKQLTYLLSETVLLKAQRLRRMTVLLLTMMLLISERSETGLRINTMSIWQTQASRHLHGLQKTMQTLFFLII